MVPPGLPNMDDQINKAVQVIKGAHHVVSNYAVVVIKVVGVETW